MQASSPRSIDKGACGKKPTIFSVLFFPRPNTYDRILEPTNGWVLGHHQETADHGEITTLKTVNHGQDFNVLLVDLRHTLSASLKPRAHRQGSTRKGRQHINAALPYPGIHATGYSNRPTARYWDITRKIHHLEMEYRASKERDGVAWSRRRPSQRKGIVVQLSPGAFYTPSCVEFWICGRSVATEKSPY